MARPVTLFTGQWADLLLAELAKKRPDVVMMDIQLADSTGELDNSAGNRAARQIQALTWAQIIFVNGLFDGKEVIAEAHKVGGCQFSAKPFTDDQIFASVRLAAARTPGKKLVFVCYAREDSTYADELMKHINTLGHIGINAWVDTQINFGQNWEKEIEQALVDAYAAICLVSINFVSSEYIQKVELPQLQKAAVDHGLQVIPVFVNYVAEPILRRVGLLDFQGVNGPDDPIAAWRPAKREKDCWGALCKRLESAVADSNCHDGTVSGQTP